MQLQKKECSTVSARLTTPENIVLIVDVDFIELTKLIFASRVIAQEMKIKQLKIIAVMMVSVYINNKHYYCINIRHYS